MLWSGTLKLLALFFFSYTLLASQGTNHDTNYPVGSSNLLLIMLCVLSSAQRPLTPHSLFKKCLISLINFDISQGRS